MDAHMSALRDVLRCYVEAVEAVLVKCYAASNHGIERNEYLSWDFAMANLKHAHYSFLSACKEARKFHVHVIRKQPAMYQTKALVPDAQAQLKDQSIPLVKDQADMEEILKHNHGDPVDMSEEDNMFFSLHLAELDLYKSELHEILEMQE